MQPDFIPLLLRSARKKEFPKGHVLVQPGEVQQELYLVESGVQMSVYEEGGRPLVLAFSYAPGFCALPDSFSLQQPANSRLECVTDSVLHALTYTQLQTLLAEVPGLERFLRQATEQVLAGLIQRHIEWQTLDMEARYLLFCRRSGHLLQKVPHKYIASYLGIDPTNFSKLYNRVKI